MKLIIGLGNPGKEHEKTRHNIGWMIINEFQQQHADDFSPFTENKKFHASITISGQVILAKPLTFMNNSGQAVQTIMHFYKIKPKDLLVIHDDLDLEFGKTKFETNRSSAGHNGVQSIIQMIGTKDFARARVGVGKERRGDAAKFVLNNFGFFEKTKLKHIISNVLEQIDEFIKK